MEGAEELPYYFQYLELLKDFGPFSKFLEDGDSQNFVTGKDVQE